MATVNGVISATADDLQIHYNTEWVTQDDLTLWFGKWNGYNHTVALRFTLDAAIPSSATIYSADLKMYGSGGADVDELWAYVTESADGSQITAASQRPTWLDSGSTTTYPTSEEGTGAVHWIGTWTLDAWNTVSVTGLIQHLVDTYGGLSSGAHVVVWVIGDNSLSGNIESGLDDYDATNKATLTITYTTEPTLTQTQFRFFSAGDELPHMDAAIVPVIESGDITHTNNTSTSTSSKSISYPAYANGDLIIVALASDADVSHTPPSSGPNSETINVIADDIDPGSNGPHLSIIWWVGSGSHAAGTQTWTLSANETCSADAILVPAGEFYATTPIGTIGTAGSSDSDQGNATMPAFTPNRSGGRVVCIGGVDADPMASSYAPSGWTARSGAARDDGAQNIFVATRDTLTTASTQVGSADFDINASDSYSCIGFVVNGTVATADGRTPLAAAGTDPELEVDTDYGVSIRVENSGSATTEDTYKWQYKKNSGSWTDVSSSSSVLKAYATSDFANGDDVPEYITGSGTYVTNNNAALDTAGSLTLAAVLGAGYSFESHLNFRIVSGDVVDGDIIYLRIVEEDGTALDSYGTSDTNIPAITVNETGGAYSLSCAAGSYALTGLDMSPLRTAKVDASGGSYALTGQDAGAYYGRKVAADTGTYALTGQDATLLRAARIAADAGDYALTGQDLAALLGRKLEAEAGSYALTGEDIAFIRGYGIAAEAGAYALSGLDSTLLRNALLSAEAGSFSVTGQDAELLRGYGIVAEAGSYVVTGETAALLRTAKLAAEAGAYDVTGLAATFVYTPIGAYVISAEGGVYAVTGADIGIRRDAKIAADAGAYVVTGQDAATLLGRLVEAGAGSYELTGQDTALLRDAVLAIEAGAYAVTGGAATLTYAAAIVSADAVRVKPSTRTIDVSGSGRTVSPRAASRTATVNRRRSWN
jgi:hypothetical protein